MAESDVEMVARGSASPDVNLPLPPPSSAPTSRSSVAPLPTTSGPSGTKPSSSTTKPAAKPRSTKPAKPARTPSPSPPPPPPVVPLQTIRLQIRLGGPSNYEVDICRLAKDSGQRAPTPPAPVKKVADSSDSEEEDKDDKSRSKKNKVSYNLFIVLAGILSLSNISIQKKNVVSEYYDTSDPFIDDSELAIDERQFFAQTKQQGFYVSSGEVALLKDKYVQIGLPPDLNSLISRIELPRNLNPRKFHL
jgi:HPC2 and ubinuclein domain